MWKLNHSETEMECKDLTAEKSQVVLCFTTVPGIYLTRLRSKCILVSDCSSGTLTVLTPHV